MEYNSNIDSFIDDIVERYIPAGIDPYLHIDRRKMMKKLITSLLQREDSKTFTLAQIIIMSKDWESYLYHRAALYN